MPDDIVFAFIREGASDDGLIPHLQQLLVRAGARSALGAPRAYSGTLSERFQQVLSEGSLVDLVLVHRDSDDCSAQSRRSEIENACTTSGLPHSKVIPVIPIQELEAWLLVDESEIRWAAGKPRGSTKLSIPKLSRIEQTARPKEVLEKALNDAANLTGRRKRQANFNSRRIKLLSRLDIEGPVCGLPSWQQLVADIEAAVQAL